MKRQSEKLSAPADMAFQVGRAIDAWRLKEDKTQADLQRIAKVSQGQISRILAGKFSHVGPPIERLCIAAGIEWPVGAKDKASQALHRRLYAELDRSWDGSTAGAEALIELLRLAWRLRSGGAPIEDAAVD